MRLKRLQLHSGLGVLRNACERGPSSSSVAGWVHVRLGFGLCIAVPVTADLINLMTARSNGFSSHYSEAEGQRKLCIVYRDSNLL
jgi:hypothetical protein